MAVKTYRGSCHCGTVKYEADIDLSQGTGKCNCSMCTKTRKWGATLKPSAFRLIAGQDAVTDYQFASKTQHHFFCSRCGVHVFGKGYVEAIGGDYYSISVATLDDVDLAELIEAPLTYFDGRNNAWFERPAETRHL